MPTTEIGTLSKNGETNLSSYSLCFPYYIAGKDYYAMVLCCRSSSNKVPRVFLNTVLKGCVTWEKENNVTTITEKEMEIIQDKRNKEKK